jgi:hypothetical protein
MLRHAIAALVGVALCALPSLAMHQPDEWDWKHHPEVREVVVEAAPGHNLVEFDVVRHDLLAEKKSAQKLDDPAQWPAKAKKSIEKARVEWLDALFAQVKNGLVGLHGEQAQATYKGGPGSKKKKDKAPSVEELRHIKQHLIIMESTHEWAKHGVTDVVHRLRNDKELRRLGMVFLDPHFGEK